MLQRALSGSGGGGGGVNPTLIDASITANQTKTGLVVGKTYCILGIQYNNAINFTFTGAEKILDARTINNPGASYGYLCIFKATATSVTWSISNTNIAFGGTSGLYQLD